MLLRLKIMDRQREWTYIPLKAVMVALSLLRRDLLPQPRKLLHHSLLFLQLKQRSPLLKRLQLLPKSNQSPRLAPKRSSQFKRNRKEYQVVCLLQRSNQRSSLQFRNRLRRIFRSTLMWSMITKLNQSRSRSRNSNPMAFTLILMRILNSELR